MSRDPTEVEALVAAAMERPRRILRDEWPHDTELRVRTQGDWARTEQVVDDQTYWVCREATGMKVHGDLIWSEPS